MTYYPIILVDSGILVAYYSNQDPYHQQVRIFFERCTSNLLTTTACITEVMWLLSDNWQTQNLFLQAVAKGVFKAIALMPDDFSRIAKLNQKYADLPGDFADLSLIAISERLNIPAIATLDSDFDVYRRYQRQPFERAFIPEI
ncbi:PIN domain-containing protein [Spirulina sp. CCNP1310]|uniref:type II toxin-antitoxin system VapC family toxin n=1 Tax=Spirulina sp. CCNP1310 TaxID=3110249 RepID=UPI002B2087D1|nr:PIN domain-containing protein [Spirulina sp. CCNP1310]MEA5419312.1 PIN domain-containing protein [Spirulina sp. CCNP1310]